MNKQAFLLGYQTEKKAEKLSGRDPVYGEYGDVKLPIPYAKGDISKQFPKEIMRQLKGTTLATITPAQLDILGKSYPDFAQHIERQLAIGGNRKSLPGSQKLLSGSSIDQNKLLRMLQKKDVKANMVAENVLRPEQVDKAPYRSMEPLIGPREMPAEPFDRAPIRAKEILQNKPRMSRTAKGGIAAALATLLGLGTYAGLRGGKTPDVAAPAPDIHPEVAKALQAIQEVAPAPAPAPGMLEGMSPELKAALLALGVGGAGYGAYSLLGGGRKRRDEE